MDRLIKITLFITSAIAVLGCKHFGYLDNNEEVKALISSTVIQTTDPNSETYKPKKFWMKEIENPFLSPNAADVVYSYIEVRAKQEDASYLENMMLDEKRCSLAKAIAAISVVAPRIYYIVYHDYSITTGDGSTNYSDSFLIDKENLKIVQTPYEKPLIKLSVKSVEKMMKYDTDYWDEQTKILLNEMKNFSNGNF